MLIQIQEPKNASVPCLVEAVGIDLGTTHFLVAYAEEAVIQMVPLGGGGPLVPSLWGIEEGQMVCGPEARALQRRFPEKVVSSIKRLMGRVPQDDVALQFPHVLRDLSGNGLALEMGGGRRGPPFKFLQPF